MVESKSMAAIEEQPCIGLFGTCGSSTFRQEKFIPVYKELKIPYFNPQVEDWKSELADIEADHLAYDVVQCWPVTGETYGSGSLAEQGYSIASSLRAPSPLPKFIIPMIEMELDPSLDDEIARNESLRARKLAATHIRNSESPNIFVVASLDEMLDKSVVLFTAARTIVDLVRTNNPAFRRFQQGRHERQIFASAFASGNLGKDARNLK